MVACRQGIARLAAPDGGQGMTFVGVFGINVAALIDIYDEGAACMLRDDLIFLDHIDLDWHLFKCARNLQIR